jgi:hypothetical protein
VLAVPQPPGRRLQAFRNTGYTHQDWALKKQGTRILTKTRKYHSFGTSADTSLPHASRPERTIMIIHKGTGGLGMGTLTGHGKSPGLRVESSTLAFNPHALISGLMAENSPRCKVRYRPHPATPTARNTRPCMRASADRRDAALGGLLECCSRMHSTSMSCVCVNPRVSTLAQKQRETSESQKRPQQTRDAKLAVSPRLTCVLRRSSSESSAADMARLSERAGVQCCKGFQSPVSRCTQSLGIRSCNLALWG